MKLDSPKPERCDDREKPGDGSRECQTPLVRLRLEVLEERVAPQVLWGDVKGFNPHH